MRIDQIINGPDEGVGARSGFPHDSTTPSLGLLTKTLAGSPVVRWILPARIRNRRKDDLVFVGEDYIHIKEISEEGHLQHVATKADFGCRIMSAKVIGNVDDLDGVNENHKGHVKTEDEEMTDGCPTKNLPPQMLVLALETQQLLFMFAWEDSSGSVNFDLASSIPLPAFPIASQQLGKYLAVDPRSRAVAVAAAQDNVYIYSGKPMERLNNGTATWDKGFLPVSSERQLKKIKGVVLHMDFLYPPNDDPDHIILLLVVMKDRRLTLRRIEWLYSSDVHEAHIHPSQKLSKDHPLPTLLIPVKSNNAAFLLLSKASNTIDLYEDILSGLAVDKHLTVPHQLPKYLCTSSNLPVWIAWARPRRVSRADRNQDCLYLASEDGWVYYVVLEKQHPSRSASVTHVNHLDCNIDSAFACYGNVSEPDLFAVGGDMSEGGIHKVLIPSKNGMGSQTMATFPDWTPAFDVVASSLPRTQEKTARSRDALFTPGNRQPYGKLSELRFGLQARIDPERQFSAEELASTDRLWILPTSQDNDLRLLLSRPTESKLMSIPAVIEETNEIYFIDADGDDGLDMRHRTLAMTAIGQHSKVVQITEDGLFVLNSELQKIFTDRCPPDSRIVAADIAVIEGNQAVAITATRIADHTLLHIFRIDLNPGTNILNSIGEQTEIASEVLGITICTNAPASFAVVSTSDSNVYLFAASPHHGLVSVSSHQLPESGGSPNACEDILVLYDDAQPASAPFHDLMVLCGLRNGDICTIGLRSHRSDEHPISTTFQNYSALGLTTVRLRRDHSFTGRNAYGTSSSSLFSIKWNGAGSQELKISEIWLTNAADTTFRQDAVAAFACVPGLDTYPARFSYALVVICASDGFITNVEDDVKIVPRALPLEGTPNRAMYASRIGCFVTSSALMIPRQSFTMKPLDSTNTSELLRIGYKARCIKSVIEFTPPGREDMKYIHHTESGTRVFAMAEWGYRNAAGKEYAFIAVGTGPIDATAPVKGELKLLQPILRDGSVQEVLQRKTLAKFDRYDQVTAIATYGAHDLVACVGNWIYLYRFLPEQTKFEEVCKYKFTSAGVHISTAPPLVHVTTSNDSLITLHLTERAATGLVNGTTSGTHFRPVGMDSKFHQGIHHLTITLPQSTTQSSSPAANQPLSLNIMSTRDCKLLGYLSPSPNSRTHTNAVTTLFSAALSRSQMRLRSANIRPPWKPAHVPGVLEDRLIGVAVDGTITGLALLEPATAHRLRWVQRLCERSKAICPWSPRHMNDDFEGESDHDHDLDTVLPPLGFGDENRGGRRILPEEMHIDGDILLRLLHRGGADILRQMLQEEATRRDRLADWVRANLESQLGMVEALIQEVKRTLDRWY